MHTTLRPLAFLLITALGSSDFVYFAPPVRAQSVTPTERKIGLKMLKDIVATVRDNYYDPNFHGVDLNALAKKAEEQINQAETADLVFATIADVLDALKDSHTAFIPPEQIYVHDYGWDMKMIGNRCYVAEVKNGSDAETKGLKIGDVVLLLNGISITRENFGNVRYFYGLLSPQPGFRLTVQTTDGQKKQMDIAAKIEKRKGQTGWVTKFIRNAQLEDADKRRRREGLRIYPLSDEVAIWPLRRFILTDEEVDDALSKARKYKSLILDLRGDFGGWVDTLVRLAGHFFDREMRIAEVHERKKRRVLKATPHGSIYKGQLLILVDSDTSSAAEVFARIIQLGGRGRLIGDQTAGRVMVSQDFQLEIGTNTAAWYFVSVTVADLIMPDGSRIEKVGVTPDELLLPGSADLAAKHDPVLARAANLLGVSLTPEAAGKLSERWSAADK